ncbi:hypothetical protein [Streptosporangium fragile]|uniref:hypothetical protein n=1 Tax=Streptosporangium fragile TaxID=46186 RepID=UPI0031EAD396
MHDGHGIALVSVRVGLVVWCHGDRYWWRTGWNPTRQRFTYTWHAATDPAGAARRVASRCADLRNRHPLSELVTEARSEVV